MNDKYPNLAGCVFIVTYGRSGSTLLQKILQSIPDSCIRGENNGTFNPIFRAYAQAKKAQQKIKLKSTKKDHPWYGVEKIKLETFGQSLVSNFVDNILVPPKTVKWLGFKEIRFGGLTKDFDDCMNFIHESFPNTHIIFNLRSAEDVSKSAWNAKHPKEKVVKMVSRLDEQFLAYSAKYPAHTFVAHYEQTVLNPNYLETFFNRINEPFDLEKVKKIMETRLTH